MWFKIFIPVNKLSVHIFKSFLLVWLENTQMFWIDQRINKISPKQNGTKKPLQNWWVSGMMTNKQQQNYDALMVPMCVKTFNVFQLHKINFSLYAFIFSAWPLIRFILKLIFGISIFEKNFIGWKTYLLNNGFEMLVIDSRKAQGNSSELKDVVPVINEEPKVLIFKVKYQSI